MAEYGVGILRATRLLSLFVFAALVASGAASAAEQVVIPFTCKVEGERVVLSPGPEQAYRIIGKRQQRKFTTCSPFQPNQCRSWTLHRFAIDCGGQRADWQSVVAAMAPWTMPKQPQYGAPSVAGAPGPYPPPYLAHRYGPPIGPGPYGAARPYPPAPRQLIDLPPGFAPNPGQIAHFADAPEAATPDMAEAEPIPPPSRKPEMPAQGAAVANAEAPASPPASSGEHAISVPTQVEPGADVAKQAKTEPSAASAQIAQGSGDITAAIPEPSATAAKSSWFNLIGAAGLSFAALVLFLAVLASSKDRSRSLQLAEAHSRAPAMSVPPWDGAIPAPLGSTFHRSREQAPPSPPPPSQSDWLPSTLSEALEVLGASPETRIDMLKAIVKSLRRTWHPDLAAHEEERRVRERKLKQVNVAWDIVSGKRRVRKPPAAA